MKIENIEAEHPVHEMLKIFPLAKYFITLYKSRSSILK